MNLEELQTLLDYHYWARDRMLEAVERLTPEQYTRELGNSFTSVRDTVVHTYFAEWSWYLRWAGTSPTSALDPAQFPDVATIRMAWKSQEEHIRLFLASLGSGNLDRVFEYRTMAGQESKSIFWHMLQHVVNHGTYHRGQITTLLRQLGAPPPKAQDLIVFYRERAARVH